MRDWPHMWTKPVARLTRATFGAAALIAAASSAYADPIADATALLDQVEDHCIQPFSPYQTFMNPPDGWTLIPQDRIEAAFDAAMIETDVLIAVGYFDWDANGARADELIPQEAESSRGYARRDLNEGQAVLLEHLEGNAKLFIRTDGDSEDHAECTLWGTTADHPLHDLIKDRWALPVPHPYTTPYGLRHDVIFGIFINGKFAELFATVTEATPAAGPVPVLLTLNTSST